MTCVDGGVPPPAYLEMVDKSMTVYSVSWRKCYGEAIINKGQNGHFIDEIRSNDQPERKEWLMYYER